MAMTKTCSPTDWDFEVPFITLVECATNGLRGHDRRQFLKRASHQFLPYLERMQLKVGEVPVHLIALGAAEHYGPNRNGDAFKEVVCRSWCHTFEKFARWYRNHKNKDPQLSYGLVKAAIYNEAMHRVELLVALNATKEAALRNGGLVADQELEKLARDEMIPVSMACALPGTPVKVVGGFKPVEEITIGDRVLTHRGRYRRVTAVTKRSKRQYVEVKLRYSGRRTLRFTPEHLFYVARWDDLPRSNPRKSADPTGCSRRFRQRRRHELAAHARWIPCGELRPGDMLLMPRACGGQSWSKLTPKQARLLGYYAAEGSLTSDGYVCLTCGKEDDAVTEIHDLVACPVSTHEHSASAKAVNVSVYDKELGQRVAVAVGCGVRNKKIPCEVYAASADVKLEFLAAWFNGDGWQDVKGLHWSTCSETLSIELQMLLASIDVPASVYRIDHTSDLPDRPRTGEGIEYTVNISNRYSGLFVGRSKAELVEMRAEKTTVFITGDYLALPVEKLRFVEEDVEVYDLTVQDDESFTAYGMAVHNCRVPYDICSWCGNKAATRDDYCTEEKCAAGGCKDHLAQLVKVAGDVHHLHVVNDQPWWFDISKVWRPADRIAYGGKAEPLTKAAADRHAEPVYTVQAPLGLAAHQDAYGAPPAVALQLKLAAGLEQLEGVLDLAPELRRAFVAPVQAELPDWLLGEPRTPKFAGDLAALAERKIILPLRHYARAMNKVALAPAAARCLPGIYGRTLADGSLATRLRALAQLPTKTATAAVRTWAARHQTAMALEKQAVQLRAGLAVLRALPVPELRPAATPPSPEAQALAGDYAAYKVAALQRIASFDDNFTLTARLSLLQNQVL